jgi:hypothetical protein
MCFGVFDLGNRFQRWEYNAWYAAPIQKMTEAEIAAIEAGNGELVLSALRELRHDFDPTYENRANLDGLADKATDRIAAAHH